MRKVIHKILKEEINSKATKSLISLLNILIPPHSIYKDSFSDTYIDGNNYDVYIEYSIGPETFFEDGPYELRSNALYHGTISVLVHKLKVKNYKNDEWESALYNDIPEFIWESLGHDIANILTSQINVDVDFDYVFEQDPINKPSDPSQSNFDKLVDGFKKSFPDELKEKTEQIKSFVKNYVQEKNFNIKYLNSCTTGFLGARTKNEIIICSPSNMQTIGDFIYTIFHEIRHEEQMTKFKISNPLIGDLSDFEDLSERYWNLELDADRFAKEMVAKLIIELSIPIEIAQQQFKLSSYIENYPSLSSQIKHQLKHVIEQINKMKESGEEYTDIADHHSIKRHLDKLESFF